MKKNRILFIEFLKITAANHLAMMIKGMAKQNDCTIILLCQKNSYLARELKKKIITYEIDYIELNLHNPQTWFQYIKTSLRIFEIIKKFNINIIHCHRLNWAYLGIIPSIVFKIPIFVHIVIIEKLTSKFQNFLLKVHRDIKYITVSKDSLEKFKNMYKISNRNITHHYGGIFIPDMIKGQKKKIHWLENQEKKHIISMISRMDPLKGVDVFIEASAILASEFPNLYFMHIGNHPDYTFRRGFYEECLKRVKNLNLQNKFTFVDYNENILAYYKYFHLMVLPTMKDTLSYVNLEANYNKLPVIFTDVDGLKETSKLKFECSIPYPPSPIILAKKIKELLLDEVKYKSLKQNVYDYVINNFDAEKNASRLIKIYETMQ